MTDVLNRDHVSTGRRPNNAASAGSRRRHRFRSWVRANGFLLSVMAPVLLFLLVAQFYPLMSTVFLGFTDTKLTGGNAGWVGLDNYVDLATTDRKFWPIVANSLLWVIGSAGLQLVVGTAAALVLNQALRWRALWRGLLMVPWVTPVVVVAIIWRWLFEGSDAGLVNAFLIDVGLLDEGIVWLADDIWVWPVLLLASVWKGAPLTALLVLAALQAIPKENLEAAEVDGAGRVKRFVHVVLPALRPTLFATSMISLVTTWFKFELIWALTNGGPGFATSILPTYVYTLAFDGFDFGRAGAVATMAMLLILCIAGLYSFVLRERKRG